ncbi:MAG: helix-turn-helix transcriptional regulator [Actinomycetota bacterium]|nr:helix-turn-helix transcriptional regulator [Actinomycetota bacterium]
MQNVDDSPFLDLEDVRRMVSKWAVDCGRRVQDRRTSLNWDRNRLATLVGTTEATITRVEQGVINPRDYMKLAIAAALVVEVEDLWPYPRRADVFALAPAALV